MRRSMYRVGLALMVAALLSASVSNSIGASAGATAGAPTVPTLEWRDCGNGFECATALVPLDYTRPTGRKISLGLIRQPATDRVHRLGSVFFGEGGPGGSGIDELRGGAPGKLPGLNARFDLVSFDPRGVGESTPVRCFSDDAEQQAFYAAHPSFPLTDAERNAGVAAARHFARGCARFSGDLLSHLSTANVARDLDLLRQAVGDDKLSYVGASYGTFLGETYANLFPDKVRAMVFDGVLDPEAYMGTGSSPDASASLRVRSAIGSTDTLGEFVRLCAAAGPAGCAFASEGAAETQSKLDGLMERLRNAPITVAGPTPKTWSYQQVVDAMAQGMPAPAAWPPLASLLQTLATSPSTPGARPTSPASNGTAWFPPENAILCGETNHARTADQFDVLAQGTDLAAPVFGLKMTYGNGGYPCFAWRASDTARYTGPWNRDTAATILLVENRFDPATPYAGAVNASRRLARTRFLTVDSWGHTFLLSPNSCAAKAVLANLVDGTLPAPGTVCPPDSGPFPVR